MDNKKKFYELIEKSEAIILATSSDGKITMRLISSILYHQDIVFFTNANSTKYKQLQKNPNCCISINNMFVEGIVEFYGSTMLNENKAIREAYDAKFPGAFNSNEEFGGYHSEFIIIHPIRLSGWEFEGENPTIPFEIFLNEGDKI